VLNSPSLNIASHNAAFPAVLSHTAVATAPHNGSSGVCQSALIFMIRHPLASAVILWRTPQVLSSLLLLSLVVLWDASGLDRTLALAHMPAGGFVRNAGGLLSKAAHDATHRIGWLGLLGVVIWACWPVRSATATPRWAKLGALAGMLAALLAVVTLKYFSETSCPNTLQGMGGNFNYISHWHWQHRIANIGTGRCFPAGHASTGFAFVALFWALRLRQPQRAAWALSMALVFGFTLGVMQQLRGEHFMSHTLWTLWICWTSAVLCHAVSAGIHRLPKRTSPV
jgi:membrane-associated PAP2 superfamily phosphatase